MSGRFYHNLLCREGFDSGREYMGENKPSILNVSA
jgi:hypothetical protein